MLTTRRRRKREHGQVLILALAFIAAFALVVTAVLAFASTTALQHAHTEVTAQSDAAGEGGAAFAAANAARSTLSWCANGPSTPPGTDTGTLTMTDGTTATYSGVSCDPGQTSTSVAAQGHCLLCILNQTAFGSTAKYKPTTQVFTAQCAQAKAGAYCLQTVGGDDLMNGSIGGSAGSAQLQACSSSGQCPGLARILLLDQGLAGGATFPSGCCQPTPVGTNFTSPIVDPLASIGDPSATVSAPAGCSSWQTCKPANCNGTAGVTQGSWSNTQGCTITLSGNQITTTNLYPGVWHSISVSGKANVVLQPGVYVLNGPFINSGQGIVCAPGTIDVNNNCVPSTGVTLYLTCIGGTVSGQQVAYIPCANAGASGATITFTGGGNTENQVNFFPTPCPAGEQVPNCPGYDGMALLTDPHLIDPNTAQCIAGTGGCTISIAGNGGSINGSVDTRSAGIILTGNGGEAVNQGFLITNSLFIQVTGKNGTGLNLTGPGSFVAVGNGCSVLVLSVYTGTAPAQLPTAVIQDQCGSNKQSGVIDFNYLP